MERKNRMWSHAMLVISTLFMILIAGCEYESPITEKPTRPVEPALLGEWVGTEWNDNDCKDRLTIAKDDESTYVISYNGALCRVWHSDVGSTAFVNVQNLDPANRKFSYYTWSLSSDRQRLTLRMVKLEGITGDSASVARLLESKLDDPDLFADATVFVRRIRG